MRINNNKATAEIDEKWNDILKLNQRMEMLKEQLTRVKDELRKTENANNHLTDKREALNKKEMETLQEASETLWVSQKVLETSIEVINYKERNKKEENGSRHLTRDRRKTTCNW